jgi:hypothetical protein
MNILKLILKYSKDVLNIQITFSDYSEHSLMEQHTFNNENNYLSTNIYSYLETSGGQSSTLNLNVVHFFQHQSYLDICGSLTLLLSCIDV